MRDLVTAAFYRTFDRLATESRRVPLIDHNESVGRYFFCHAVADVAPEVRQLVEAGRIDLVLHAPGADERTFIEFKFYVRRPRSPADGGPARGDKGGPSDKNRREFANSIDRLASCADMLGLSRYVVTFYADPPADAPATRRFSDYLDRYHHPNPSVYCAQLATAGPVDAGGLLLQGSVLEVVPVGRED